MEDHLAATVTSLRNQEFEDWEALIVDDASTDGSARVALGFCEADLRFRYVPLPGNSGRPAVPRNAGIAEARGEYIAFLDHDDLWYPNKLKRQIWVLEDNPDVAMVHSHLWVNRNDNPLWGLAYLPSPRRARATRDELRTHNVVQCSSVMIRASTLQTTGVFREEIALRTVEDYELWFRVSGDFRIAFVSEIHGTYRIHALGASATERMQERLAFLDREVGTTTQQSRKSLPRRVLERALSWPVACYFLIVDGKLRSLLRKEPRVWL